MRFQFELTGLTSLLLHHDNIDAQEDLEVWRKDPANKNFSKAGDDRTPPWSWQACLYSDGKFISMPAENLSACLRGAGAQITMRRTKTFKEMTQSGLRFPEEHLQLLVGGKQVQLADVTALKDLSFKDQRRAVEELGFKLFTKRAAIARSKHVRVRPRFDSWSVRGTIEVLREEITKDVIGQLFEYAGRAGLGDWRPGGRTPGPYGMFESALKQLK